MARGISSANILPLHPSRDRLNLGDHNKLLFRSDRRKDLVHEAVKEKRRKYDTTAAREEAEAQYVKRNYSSPRRNKSGHHKYITICFGVVFHEIIIDCSAYRYNILPSHPSPMQGA